MAGEKTEKATPKKAEDARKKGQVARSIELNGAAVLLAELVKGLMKVGIVGAVVALALLPKLDELAALVGMDPADLLATSAGDALAIAQRAAMAYLAIAFADLVWQRYR